MVLTLACEEWIVAIESLYVCLRIHSEYVCKYRSGIPERAYYPAGCGFPLPSVNARPASPEWPTETPTSTATSTYKKSTVLSPPQIVAYSRTPDLPRLSTTLPRSRPNSLRVPPPLPLSPEPVFTGKTSLLLGLYRPSAPDIPGMSD
jgi:hypothetical protein